MGRKAKSGEVNKSAMIRELLNQTPDLAVKEVVQTLADKGLTVTPNLVYFIKGKMTGKKSRRRKARRMVEKASATMSKNGAAPASKGDVVSTVLKIKHLAADLGGMKKLKALVDALSE